MAERDTGVSVHRVLYEIEAGRSGFIQSQCIENGVGHAVGGRRWRLAAVHRAA